MMLQTATYEDVIQVVRRWSLAQRFSLMQDLLQSLSTDMKRSVERPQNTLAKALGLLATSSPVPSDEEIKAWLDERRNEKYG